MLRLSILLILCLGLGMYASYQRVHKHSNNGSHGNSNWTELNTSMENMHKAMSSLESSGDNDVDFVKLMLPHHQAAIEMARTQLVYGKDPQIRRLAQEIIADQQSEIELMQLWLKRHNADSSNPGAANEKLK